MYNLTSHTNSGSKSAVNQDAALAQCWQTAAGPLALVAVADGMGGHRDGRESAELVLAQLLQCCQQVLARQPVAPLPELDREIDIALGRADAIIKQRGGGQPEGSGTTIVLCVVQGSQYFVKNIGDSRAYLLGGGSAQQLSEDHTFVAREIAAGCMSSRDAQTHPQRHVLTRCVGMGEYAPPHCMWGQLLHGQALLLASDGFYKMAQPNELAAMAAQPTPELFAAICQALRDRGERDDITTAVAAPAPAIPAEAQQPRRNKKRWLPWLMLSLGAAALLTLLVLWLVFGWPFPI